MSDDAPLTPERLAEIRARVNRGPAPLYAHELLREIDRLKRRLQAELTHNERLRSMLRDAERRARGEG